MKQYFRKVADRICDSHIRSGIRGYFHEQRTTDNEQPEQAGPVGRADFGVPQQRSEGKGLVQGERDL